MINSELMNSGSSFFQGLQLDRVYPDVAQSVQKWSNYYNTLMNVLSRGPLNLLEAPRTREYYLNNTHDIYKDFNIPKD